MLCLCTIFDKHSLDLEDTQYILHRIRGNKMTRPLGECHESMEDGYLDVCRLCEDITRPCQSTSDEKVLVSTILNKLSYPFKQQIQVMQRRIDELEREKDDVIAESNERRRKDCQYFKSALDKIKTELEAYKGHQQMTGEHDQGQVMEQIKCLITNSNYISNLKAAGNLSRAQSHDADETKQMNQLREELGWTKESALNLVTKLKNSLEEIDVLKAQKVTLNTSIECPEVEHPVEPTSVINELKNTISTLNDRVAELETQNIKQEVTLGHQAQSAMQSFEKRYGPLNERMKSEPDRPDASGCGFRSALRCFEERYGPLDDDKGSGDAYSFLSPKQSHLGEMTSRIIHHSFCGTAPKCPRKESNSACQSRSFPARQINQSCTKCEPVQWKYQPRMERRSTQDERGVRREVEQNKRRVSAPT